MKKVTVLTAIVLTSGIVFAQNRGRGGSRANVNTNIQTNQLLNNGFSNLDNNVGNYNYVQTSNVNFNNTNKIEQQVNTNPQQINVNRNLNVNVPIDNVQQLNVRGNRGGDIQIQYNEPIARGNQNDIEINEVPDVVQQVANVEPVQQQAQEFTNNDNQLAINIDMNLNVPSIDVNLNLSNGINLSNESEEVISRDNQMERDVKETKDRTLNLDVKMPSIAKAEKVEKTVKVKSAAVRNKKVRTQRGFSYKQHVSILQKIKSKTASIKKVLSKKKAKKTTCTVVCYKF